MNRQRLQSIVVRHLQDARHQRAAAGDSGPSLARALRAVRAELARSACEIDVPTEPLPSAECLAAFVAGNVTAEEEARTISACLHDPGILLQLLVAEDANLALESTEQNAVLLGGVSRTLQERLVKLGPLSVAPGHRPSTLWIPITLASVIAASFVVGFLGFVLWRSHVLDSRHPEIATQESPLPSRQPPEASPVDGPQQASKVDTGAEPTEPDGDRAPPLPTIEGLVVEPSVPNPSMPRENPRPDALVREPVGQPVPNSIPTPSNTAPAMPDVPAIAWRQVVGILGEKNSSGLDRWRPIYEGIKAERTDSEDRDPDGFEGITLSRSFARGALRLGGEIVMDQQSHCRLSVQSQSMEVGLRRGAMVLNHLPSGTEVFWKIEPNGRIQWTIEETASLHLRLENGQYAMTVLSGLVQGKSGPIPLMHRLLVTPDDVRDSGIASSAPAWLGKLPTNTIASRAILANLRRSPDLKEALNQAMVSLLAGQRSRANPMAEFDLLCQWRGELAVDEPLEPILHPHWLVRHHQWERLRLESDLDPFWNAARDEYLKRLPANVVAKWRAWMILANGQGSPTRTDLGDWLGLLEDNDPMSAGLGDYLLRKCMGPGPDFDPTAPTTIRQSLRRQWTRLIGSRANQSNRIP